MSTPETRDVDVLGRQIARLATEMLGASFVAPPNPGPSAAAVGAGGASPAVLLPPIPGALQTPPLPNAPPPRESDLRAAPNTLAQGVGLPPPVLVAAPLTPLDATPYFLSGNGLPASIPSGAPSAPPAAFDSLPTPYFLSGAGLPTGIPSEAPASPLTPTHSESLPNPYFPRGPAFPASIPSEAPTAALPSAALPTTALPTTALPTTALPTTALPTTALPSAALPAVAAPESLPARPSAQPGRLDLALFHPELTPNLGIATSKGTAFDAHLVRRDFPILEERVHGGKRLIWLDNGATTQKPRAVIERVAYFYEHENSNIHRAAHALAARATDAYEAAREKTRRFLNAPSAKDIVFVRGGTEAINLVAQSWGRRHVGPGDEIIVTWLEHHANIVPWQQLAQEKGAVLRVVPVDDDGQVLLEAYERLLGPKTRIVSLTHVSNALGTIVPARVMTEMAHRYGARVLVDGAQAVSHMPVDVQALDCDFYCFSGHKVFAPTGIGALYGKSEVLETMPPWQGGGNMIEDVTFEKTRYQSAPQRFEAGTGNIADAVGLGAALDYLGAIGLETVSRYEHDLLAYATERLRTVPGLKLIGTAPDKAGVLSFVLDGQRTEDVGAALDQEGIAVRSGHHCAQPILRRFGLESTVRASLALYNTCEDLDALVDTLLALQSSTHFRRG